MTPIESAIEKLERKYNTCVLAPKAVEKIPIGVTSLELVLDGGIPRGRITEIYGEESSGKTTLAFHIIAEAQKTGIAAFINVEHAPTEMLKYAERIGVNLNELLFYSPSSGEAAKTVGEELISSGEINLIVLDSVAALTPSCDMNKSLSELDMEQNNLIVKTVRSFSELAAKHNVAVVLLNQIRTKLFNVRSIVDIDTTVGSKIIRSLASLRLKVSRNGDIKFEDEEVGTKIKVYIVQNNLGSSGDLIEIDTYFGKGFSTSRDLVEVALQTGTFTKNGSWCYYNNSRLAQGKEGTAKLLEDDATLTQEVKETIICNYHNAPQKPQNEILGHID